jgi:hypothetical protein
MYTIPNENVNKKSTAYWELSPEDRLRYILYSGSLSKIAQHIALTVLIVTNGHRVPMSLRDIERITGWGKSTIAEHLPEVEKLFPIERRGGRAKPVICGDAPAAVEDDRFAPISLGGANV